ncbi:FadR/GntR family transcriptional regulator [Flavobacterium algicola]|uniref:FadR/GntR family transcriptional regulator n=1 Tax=Flavobacterium algicola TaxID=556529 RepID=UPI001EFCE33B|nr:FCD domain-containing protein [Flavobacterium algicola]MCG9792253.1 FCD domain-containing protein [Flavobacterium algicola]
MKSKTVRIKDNIEVQNMIFSKIRDYIISKNLGPGDKLPSERELSDNFDVSRRFVVEAIEKLEFYGLVNSMPQSGTFLAEIGHIALIGIIEDIITLEKKDFLSLVETRLMLEAKSVYLAATRRTDEDLKKIEAAFNRYKTKILSGEDALQEDLLFHLAIVKASKNSSINDLMLQITPKIISVFRKTRVSNEEGFNFEVAKHEAILNAIRDKNPEEAVKRMEFHFNLLIEFCNDFK